jgi:hypothetical protein
MPATQNISLDISGLEKGIFLIRYQTGNISEVKTLVKQ